MDKIPVNVDALEAIVIKSIRNFGIEAGITNPCFTVDEFDTFRRQFLLPGSLFWGIIEERYYIGQIADYYSNKSESPFFSPGTQLWGFHRFAGLLAMRCLSKINLMKRTKSMANIKEEENLRDLIRAAIKANRWPANSVIVYNFSDAYLNAELAWLYLSWMHRGTIASKKYFTRKHLQLNSRAQKLPLGYQVVELPPKDWEHGIGATYKGLTTEEVESGLTDGWQLMSWEGLQLLGYMPYYAAFMDTIRVPDILLSGFRCRLNEKGSYSAIPSLSFDKKNMQLELGYQLNERIPSFCGHGVVRHLGPLEKFI